MCLNLWSQGSTHSLRFYKRLLCNSKIFICSYIKPSVKQHYYTIYMVFCSASPGISSPASQEEICFSAQHFPSSAALEVEGPAWADQVINHCHVSSIKTHRLRLYKYLYASLGNLTHMRSCKKAPSSNNYFVQKDSKWFKSSTLTLKSNIST